MGVIMNIGIYADGTQSEQDYQESIERNYKELLSKTVDYYVSSEVQEEK